MLRWLFGNGIGTRRDPIGKLPPPRLETAEWSDYAEHRHQLLETLQGPQNISQEWRPNSTGARQTNQFEQIRDGLEQDTCDLMVLGAFKRGKSRLINALLRHPHLCPVAVEPLTALVTEIRFGHKEGVHVELEADNPTGSTTITDSLDHLDRYVATTSTTEGSRARKNREGNDLKKYIQRVVVTCRSSFLESGIRLYDTPGIGAVDHAHSNITLRALPLADMSLFVIDCTVPLGATDIDFLSLAYSSNPRMIFVLSKIDQRPEEWEDSLSHVLEHFKRINLKSPEVYPVSSKWLQDADIAGDIELWERSGFPALEMALGNHLGRRRLHTKIGAVTARSLVLALQMDQAIDLERRSLGRNAQDLAIEAENWKSRLEQAESDLKICLEVFSEKVRQSIQLFNDSTNPLSEGLWNELLHEIDGFSSEQMASQEALNQALTTVLQRATRATYGPARQIATNELEEAITGAQKHFSRIIGSLTPDHSSSIRCNWLTASTSTLRPFEATYGERTTLGLVGGGAGVLFVTEWIKGLALGGAAIKILIPALVVGVILGVFVGAKGMGDLWVHLKRIAAGSPHERIKKQLRPVAAQIANETREKTAHGLREAMGSIIRSMELELKDQVDATNNSYKEAVRQAEQATSLHTSRGSDLDKFQTRTRYYVNFLEEMLRRFDSNGA